MMIRVFASLRAKAEIEGTAAYLEEEFSAAPAARCPLSGDHHTDYQMLSEHPDVGPIGTRPGTRRLVVGNYIVSYPRWGNEVEIFAVRHARRRDARL